MREGNTCPGNMTSGPANEVRIPKRATVKFLIPHLLFTWFDLHCFYFLPLQLALFNCDVSCLLHLLFSKIVVL